jgi:hypothetical protein
VDESVWDCDFDSGSFCEFYDAGVTNAWRVLSGSTPTSSTGPSDDFLGGGYYVYAESNFNAALTGGHRLQLDFGYAFTGTGISFAYHLYGSQLGQFKLMTSQDGTNWDTIWSKQGNINTGWLYTTVSITNNPISIQFVSDPPINHSSYIYLSLSLFFFFFFFF